MGYRFKIYAWRPKAGNAHGRRIAGVRSTEQSVYCEGFRKVQKRVRLWKKICCNSYFSKAALLQTDYGQAGSRSYEISHISSAVRDSIHVPWAVIICRIEPRWLKALFLVFSRLELISLIATAFNKHKQSLTMALNQDDCSPSFLHDRCVTDERSTSTITQQKGCEETN